MSQIKKRVALIYSGQIRTNSLSKHPRDTRVLDSLSRNFLTPEFKEKYDYDVFISTDAINIDAADMFFGDNLKNIAILEEGWTRCPIAKTNLPTLQELYSKFINRDFGGYNSYASQYYQYYRSYLAYEMVLDHIAKTGVQYDYFIKLRPDIILQKNLMPIFEQLDLGKKAFMEHNLLEVASFELFDVLYYLAHHYGEYHRSHSDGNNNNNEYPNYCPMDCNAIKFSSEMQVTNCYYNLMEFKGCLPSKYFFGSIYNGPSGSDHTYSLLYR